MPPYLPVIIILSAAVLAILVVLYRLYDSRVEQPKKLEDELREGLGGFKADVQALEPVRKAAAASSFAGDRIIIVRNFGKIPHKPYTMAELMGIEVFVDDKVAGRVVRGGPTKLLDDIAPTVHRVTLRLMFDDPSDPDFELVIWDPHDAMTARAEGPRAALNNARKWFYHVEAVLRRTSAPPKPASALIAAPPPMPPPMPPMPAQLTASVTPAPASPKADAPPKSEGDVLNAPMIPYL
ncbi:hypothetical protein [Asticcacaulis sp. EMRT-3]|uniref:hypothetical protein n=1 Tax=Asticcacaulis sp. EMRT-3 TaxID=3040349 RepID=UPI0024AFA656|nr:hypothetical protein [Asticcacaulis sp. EMRT-3]MDI7774257.1 hypothetical protein [Asticcacaulis sp. EMRT-3]